MNFTVILINRLISNGEIGEKHYHIFRDANHFEKWFIDEQKERYDLYKLNPNIEEIFDIS